MYNSSVSVPRSPQGRYNGKRGGTKKSHEVDYTSLFSCLLGVFIGAGIGILSLMVGTHIETGEILTPLVRFFIQCLFMTLVQFVVLLFFSSLFSIHLMLMTTCSVKVSFFVLWLRLSESVLSVIGLWRYMIASFLVAFLIWLGLFVIKKVNCCLIFLLLTVFPVFFLWSRTSLAQASSFFIDPYHYLPIHSFNTSSLFFPS